MIGRAVLILAAIASAVAPVSGEFVERHYTGGVYAALQPLVTGLSNRVAFALFDALWLLAALWWIGLLARDIGRRRFRGFTWAAGRLVLRTATAAAALYLAFLVGWGLNYRRLPLESRLQLDPAGVSEAAAADLGGEAVGRLNRLWHSAREDAGLVQGATSDPLERAFARAHALLGGGPWTRPARPKISLLDPYFRAAGVEGMIDPFFLETLLASNLLPFEQPFVLAHEWSHLAGFADEGEANFVGLLACMHGPAPLEYSGWLFLYRELAGSMAPPDRTRLAAMLAPGPRADLRAIAERQQRDVRPAVSMAGWQIYDRYLKANRVAEGAASYGQVVRLVLGARMGPDWTPVLKRAS